MSFNCFSHLACTYLCWHDKQQWKLGNLLAGMLTCELTPVILQRKCCSKSRSAPGILPTEPALSWCRPTWARGRIGWGKRQPQWWVKVSWFQIHNKQVQGLWKLFGNNEVETRESCWGVHVHAVVPGSVISFIEISIHRCPLHAHPFGKFHQALLTRVEFEYVEFVLGGVGNIQEADHHDCHNEHLRQGRVGMFLWFPM